MKVTLTVGDVLEAIENAAQKKTITEIDQYNIDVLADIPSALRGDLSSVDELLWIEVNPHK